MNKITNKICRNQLITFTNKSSILIMIIILLFLCNSSVTSYTNILRYNNRIKLKINRLNCIDKKKPTLEPATSNPDDVWRTKPNNIESIDLKPFPIKPQLITFDVYHTLIEPSQSIGRWYREALHSVCDMSIRLPRPAQFTIAFNKAFSYMSKTHPCFGSNTNLTSKEWWYEVVKLTYSSTTDLNQLDKNELEYLLPKVFNLLYNDIFSTSEGWMLKENTVYTLTKLSEWRDQGGGPRLGVISNFDIRLHQILKELDISKYFDFIVTSEEAKSEKPNKEIFELAVKLSNNPAINSCYHIGDSIDNDIAGAIAAGINPIRYHEKFDEDFPDWAHIDLPDAADKSQRNAAKFFLWGRKDTTNDLQWIEIWSLDDILTLLGFPDDPDKPIATTYIRGCLDD